jgi:hypothetical protein
MVGMTAEMKVEEMVGSMVYTTAVQWVVEMVE